MHLTKFQREIQRKKFIDAIESLNEELMDIKNTLLHFNEELAKLDAIDLIDQVNEENENSTRVDIVFKTDV